MWTGAAVRDLLSMPTTSRAHPIQTRNDGIEDPIQPADYRRLFAVLDDVLAVGSLQEFRAALLGSLAHHFRWRKALIRHAPMGRPPSPADSLPASTDPLSVPLVISRLRSYGAVALSELRRETGGREIPAIERFCRFHKVVDAVVVFIDAGNAGGDHLIVMFEDRTACRSDRVLFSKLGRQLAPLLERHLPGDGTLVRRNALTAREQQVADLVVEGLSNSQIARRLHVTEETVKKHLTHVFGKTRCSSRTQLALAWSARARDN
jgi:DNA-binding CsgD family transcriptional regulator